MVMPSRRSASIHPEVLSQLSILERPTAVLTIENYASFNRQVREIEDGRLPGGGGRRASSEGSDDRTGRGTVSSLGDVDAGGVRIFRYLEENLPRGPRPHLMNKELAEKSGRPAEVDPSLASIATSESSVRELAAEWLAFGSGVRHWEQGAIDPSPLERSPLYRERGSGDNPAKSTV
jgi:hypothetical protein